MKLGQVDGLEEDLVIVVIGVEHSASSGLAGVEVAPEGGAVGVVVLVSSGLSLAEEVGYYGVSGGGGGSLRLVRVATRLDPS